ncbi:hypothetical protein [Halorussus sp. AFM4]|uniref:hypothetical protein n=1 Tax=Halorussus sp. AFM4 TaxID=3421651 RepID=UPI003EB9A064
MVAVEDVVAVEVPDVVEVAVVSDVVVVAVPDDSLASAVTVAGEGEREERSAPAGVGVPDAGAGLVGTRATAPSTGAVRQTRLTRRAVSARVRREGSRDKMFLPIVRCCSSRQKTAYLMFRCYFLYFPENSRKSLK